MVDHGVNGDPPAEVMVGGSGFYVKGVVVGVEGEERERKQERERERERMKERERERERAR